MKIHVLALAALAAIGFSGVAFAGGPHPGVQNRSVQVTTAGAPESQQFHQTNQAGTGPGHTINNVVSNKGNRP
jgi:hypothetical protein